MFIYNYKGVLSYDVFYRESDPFTYLGGCKVSKFRIVILLSVALVLGACGNGNSDSTSSGSTNDGEAANKNGAIDHGVKDKTGETDEKEIGFSLTGDTVEEATNVPDEEKLKIKALLDENIAMFNEKDIDAYMNTLSTETESFDLEEERAYITEIFSEFGVDRKMSDVTITKYADSEANVVASLVTVLKELSTEEEVMLNGRQATVVTKENGEWKIASVHYVGNSEEQ